MAGGEVLLLTLTSLNKSYSLDDPFTERPFLIQGIIYSQDFQLSIRFLIDTGATEYCFIDASIISMICERLGIMPVPLSKPKSVRGYDRKLANKLITHVIYLELRIDDYQESTIPKFITSLG